MAKTQEQQFREMLTEMRQTPAYWIEVARIDIAANIYKVMDEQQMSKADLAKAMGTSRAYVTKILQGNANFTIESLVRIAFALNRRLNFESLFVNAENSFAVPDRGEKS